VAVVFKFLPFRSESSLTAARDALTLWRQDPGQFMKLNHTLMAKKGTTMTPAFRRRRSGRA
jgi:hypothetical protein